MVRKVERVRLWWTDVKQDAFTLSFAMAIIGRPSKFLCFFPLHLSSPFSFYHLFKTSSLSCKSSHNLYLLMSLNIQKHWKWTFNGTVYFFWLCTSIGAVSFIFWCFFFFGGGGGGLNNTFNPIQTRVGRIVPRVHFLKYLKNAFSCRFETFWKLIWGNFQKKNVCVCVCVSPWSL